MQATQLLGAVAGQAASRGGIPVLRRLERPVCIRACIPSARCTRLSPGAAGGRSSPAGPRPGPTWTASSASSPSAVRRPAVQVYSTALMRGPMAWVWRWGCRVVRGERGGNKVLAARHTGGMRMRGVLQRAAIEGGSEQFGLWELCVGCDIRRRVPGGHMQPLDSPCACGCRPRGTCCAAVKFTMVGRGA